MMIVFTSAFVIFLLMNKLFKLQQHKRRHGFSSVVTVSAAAFVNNGVLFHCFIMFFHLRFYGVWRREGQHVVQTTRRAVSVEQKKTGKTLQGIVEISASLVQN